MASSMTLLFANIGYFLTVLALFTIGSCFYFKSQNYLTVSITLGAFTAAAWLPSYWDNPERIAQLHTLIVMFSMVAIHGRYGNRIVTVFVIALAADLLWAYAQAQFVGFWMTNSFYHQSLLNILTLSLCVLILFRCYNPTKEIGAKSRHTFYARTSDRIYRRMQNHL